mgnify:CR=1 FL=1
MNCRARGLTADTHRTLRHILRSAAGAELNTNFAKAHLLDRALYNASTWPALGPGLARAIHTAVLKPFRAIADAGRAVDSQSSDLQVLELLRLPTPASMIRLLRLSLYSRIVQKSAQIMRSALALGAEAQGSWAATIIDDLDYVAQYAGETRYAEWSVPQWKATALHKPALFRRALVAVFDGAPRIMSVAVARVQEDLLLQDFQCPCCEASFASSQALSVHAFRVHNVRAAVRHHVDTTFCVRCLLQLWTRQRLLDHLRRSAPCAWPAMRQPRLDEALVLTLDHESREQTRANVQAGRHRNWASTPSVLLCGPRPYYG